jgi:FtsP/CotA-like multicopper oxidase with cupredoxin domain
MQRVVALNIVKDPSTTPPTEDFQIGASCTSQSASWPPPPQLADALSNAAAFGKQGSPTLKARAGDTEVWTIYNKPQGSSHELHNFHIHQMKYEVMDVYDPTGRITAPVSEKPANRKVDSFPVPVDGYLRIRITFTSDMIGKFVFHCHILEHEDKGMMAQIEVK